jgi:hypothetical protein
MKLGHLAAVTERVVTKLQQRMGANRMSVYALPPAVQGVVIAAQGTRKTVNWAEINHILRGALAALEASASGLFHKAQPDTNVDLPLASGARRRHPAALALYELVVDRERRRANLAPALAAQRRRIVDSEGEMAAADTVEREPRHELMRLFALPLDQCLAQASAAFARANAHVPARELEALRRRLIADPDDVVLIARRARDIMKVNEGALAPAAALTHARDQAERQLLELQRAASTLPDGEPLTV